MQENKYKTFLIYQFLEKYSDEDNPVSSTQLIEMLEERGVKSERKSIYGTIDALKEAGCDIVSVISPKRGFFIAQRKFELPEVMLLIDAVTSAGFITPKKTISLVEKLKTLVSVEQAKSLVSQVYVDSPANKCDNEEIYITIDRLHGAIMQKKKVKFVYRRRNIDVENMKKHTEKTFTVSPYALIWKQDHYYLVCNHKKYDNLMNLRIDRIKRLRILDEDIRPLNEVSSYDKEFDTQDYSSKMFNMFSGEDCMATLICELKLQEEMMDRFGPLIPLKAYDGSHFETTVPVTISDGFVSWLMQYGSKIKVIDPPVLADMIKEKAQKIADIYK